MDVHGRAWKREEVTTHLNGMISPRRWNVIGPIDEIVSRGHGLPQIHPMDYLIWVLPQDHLAVIFPTKTTQWNREGIA